MRLVGTEDLYAQRAAGAATSIWMGYAQTYFLLVFSAGLVGFGLVRGRYLLVGIGFVGGVVIYMITAQRTSLLLAPTMIGFYFLLQTRLPLLKTTAFPVLVIAATIFFLLTQDQSVPLVASVSALLIFRTLAIPGLTFSQYQDIFASSPTLWSHVKGISTLVAPPIEFAHNKLWPGLGYIVGNDLYHDPLVNVNANLYSSDGLAAWGVLGVLVIGAVFATWLYFLDRFGRDWDSRFVIPALVPCALSLTNGPFFTSMLSFGGLFWLLLFYAVRPTVKEVEQEGREVVWSSA
jgi:hypothetical protein